MTAQERSATQSDRTVGWGLAAVGLAALAESGLIFLPVRLLVSQTAVALAGPLAWFPLFATLFVGGTMFASLAPERRATPVVAGAVAALVGLIQSLMGPGRGVETTAFLIVLSLAVAVRVVTLGARDWHDPIHSSFGWGAAALLVEVALADGIGGGWRSLLPIIVPVFFLASLASRAASIRWAESEGGDASRGTRLLESSVVVALAVGLGMLVAGILGGRGGIFQTAGRLVLPVLAAVISAFLFVIAEVLRPVFWLADKVHFDIRGIQKLFQSFGNAVDRLRLKGQPSQPGGFQRLLGLLAFVAIAGVVIWALQRQRRRAMQGDRQARSLVEADVKALPPPNLRSRITGALRREPPADLVRRWYAEALAAVEAKGLVRRPHLTPAEFLPEVARAFPDCRAGFTSLTRAYEDVRYGSVRMEPEVLRRLQSDRDRAMESIARAKNVEPGTEDPGPGGPASTEPEAGE